MGKTIRRKNVDRTRLGFYDYKDEQKQGKADAFFHGDMGCCTSSPTNKSFVKEQGNLQSRKEKRKIKLDPDLDISNRDLARKTAVPFYLY